MKYYIPLLGKFNTQREVKSQIEKVAREDPLPKNFSSLELKSKQLFETTDQTDHTFEVLLKYIYREYLHHKKNGNPGPIKASISRFKNVVFKSGLYLAFMKCNPYQEDIELSVSDFSFRYNREKLLNMIVLDILPQYRHWDFGNVDLSNSDKLQMLYWERNKLDKERKTIQGLLHKYRKSNEMIKLEYKITKEIYSLNTTPEQFMAIVMSHPLITEFEAKNLGHFLNHLKVNSKELIDPLSTHAKNQVLVFHLKNQLETYLNDKKLMEKEIELKEKHSKLKTKNTFKVSEWKKNNPNGLQRECAYDLNINIRTVKRYWNQGDKKKSVFN